MNENIFDKDDKVCNPEHYITPTTHFSGLWLGEAWPDESFKDVSVNPIKWSLSLLPGEKMGVIGAGFFDDAGDIQGHPVLTFIIEGQFEKDKEIVDEKNSSACASRCEKAKYSMGSVKFTKKYTGVASFMSVDYEAKITIGMDGKVLMCGSWTNSVEQTFGCFRCRLEVSHMAKMGTLMDVNKGDRFLHNGEWVQVIGKADENGAISPSTGPSFKKA